jgi:hypothetical protein
MTTVDLVRLIVLVILIAIEIFWLRMFGDMMQSEHLSGQERRQWLVMFIVFNFFAACWYYFNEYKSWH